MTENNESRATDISSPQKCRTITMKTKKKSLKKMRGPLKITVALYQALVQDQTPFIKWVHMLKLGQSYD